MKTTSPSPALKWVAFQLLMVSAAALFQEMFLVRWAPSVVQTLGYYSNIILLAGFFGLGLGALAARSMPSLTAAASPLLLLVVMTLPWLGRVMVQADPGEFDFGYFSQNSGVPAAVVVSAAFLLCVMAFVPLGQRLALLFASLSPLRAYAWDLGGSFLGTLVFGVLGTLWFEPAAVVALLGLLHTTLPQPRPARGLSLTCAVLACASLLVMRQPSTVWSPYSHLSLTMDSRMAPGQVPTDPLELRRMLDPPMNVVQVNSNFYMYAGTMDPHRYTVAGPWGFLVDQYTLPYALQPASEVLVLGAGAGMDVEGALLSGATHVDAVEIDPRIVDLGIRFNASGAYVDPRVDVHVTDARAFVARTDRMFDAVVFGFLDAQTLLSSHGNVRLDAFVYTEQSLKLAFGRVRPGGILSLSFFAGGHPWLVRRLYNMVEHACGAAPALYARPAGHTVLVCSSDVEKMRLYPSSHGEFTRQQAPDLEVASATDSWPYLYLRAPGIPAGYLLTIVSLLAMSLALGGAATWRAGARSLNAFFFFMGAAFLLMETHGITSAGLLVGSTWMVTTVVVAGVLLLVLMANGLVLRGFHATPAAFVLLLLCLTAQVIVPLDAFLALPLWMRVGVAALWVPLPIFLAGLVFSAAFENADSPSALGSNLMGAMVGGLLEYSSMAVGSQSMVWLSLGLYSTCAVLWWSARRPGVA
jgi:hypothetical protein